MLPVDYKPKDLVVPNVPFSFNGTLEESHLRKESITGYAYGPWHIRYVGDIAESIYKEKLTLEKYMNQRQ